MTHTKGLWKAKPAILNPRDPMFYKADVICGGIRIAHVAGVGEETANANAVLIAAAPELLEACTVAYEHLAELPMPSEDQEYIYNKLEDAINKAEGR